MNNLRPPMRFWPANMQLAKPTAPNEGAPEHLWQSRFAFPVHCDGTLTPALQLFVFKSLVFMLIICWLQSLLPADATFAFPVMAAISVLMGITTFFANRPTAGPSLLRQILLALLAFATGFAVFMFFSFGTCLLAAALNCFFLINRFFVHGILIRGTAPHSEAVQDEMLRCTSNRFRLYPGSHTTLVTFWFPLAAYVCAVILMQQITSNDDIVGRFICQLGVVGGLIIWPWVVLIVEWPFRTRGTARASVVDEFIRAVKSFLFYNDRNAQHPFVFQSPSGSSPFRQHSLIAVILLSSVITLSGFVFPYVDPAGQPKNDSVASGHEFVVRQRSQSDETSRHIVASTALWTLFCVGNCLVAVSIPFALCFSCCSAVFVRLSQTGFPIPMETVYTTKNWSKLVNHLHAVDGGRFGDHLLLGIDAYDGTPIILPRAALREHMHILGDTGSGKTALGISPLVEQISRFSDCSIVIFDLKGDDQTLAEILRAEGCAKSGLPPHSPVDSALWKFPFRMFHPSPNRPSHSFNPFLQKCYELMTDVERANFLAQSMGLIYGTDYARKFFSDSNSQRLLQVLREHPEIRSFEELFFYLGITPPNPKFPRSQATGENVDSAANRLAEVPALNQLKPKGHDPDASSRIDLMDLFERPQSLLLSLPAATGNTTNEDIARIFLYMLIEAAQRAPRPRRQVFVVIDEFQRIVSPNIGDILQMARSHDVALILANQSLGDLKTTSGGVVYSAVTGNTRIRQQFAIRDAVEMDDLTSTSGECLIYNASFTTSKRVVDGQSVLAESVTYTPQVSTKLRRNDIIEASDHPNRSIFQLFRSIGAAQYQGYPFILHSVHHISKAEHDRRSLLNWPAPTPSTSKIVSRPFQTELQAKNAASQRPTTTSQQPLPGTPCSVPQSAIQSLRSKLAQNAVQSKPVNISPTSTNPPAATSALPKSIPSPPAASNTSTLPSPPSTQPTSSVHVPPGSRQSRRNPLKHQPQPPAPSTLSHTPSETSSQSASTQKPSSGQTPSPLGVPPLPDPALNPALVMLRNKLNEVRKTRRQSGTN